MIHFVITIMAHYDCVFAEILRIQESLSESIEQGSSQISSSTIAHCAVHRNKRAYCFWEESHYDISYKLIRKYVLHCKQADLAALTSELSDVYPKYSLAASTALYLMSALRLRILWKQFDSKVLFKLVSDHLTVLNFFIRHYLLWDSLNLWENHDEQKKF